MYGRKQIIDKIEHYYQSYLNRQSDVLFNASTDELLDFVLNVTICKNIVSYVKELYPISNELLEKNQKTDYFNYTNDITKSKEYYISYCLHWFDYIKAKGIYAPKGYDQDCYWLYSNIRGSKDSMMLFKTDFIRPILNYIINQLTEENYILYLLDRYKQRTERFKTINPEEKRELDLQQDLFLYLFDEGLELGNSTNIGNGEVDFIIDVNGNPFIIEAKLYKKGTSYKKYISQLKDYMGKVSAYWGCLYIFTTEDVTFEFKTEYNNIFLRTIYIGDKKPSNRNTQIKIIS